ncbi:hypothetical protein E2C01_028151 [Portunus trituberculatus]|uniref:Uncharacterized protein n=1 Tax=Portunus trituberculatus TaxID=210409 RepID=A0A5B7EJR2_PORTR|nr:hypothetical protein [Portunus trituberculatus]
MSILKICLTSYKSDKRASADCRDRAQTQDAREKEKEEEEEEEEEPEPPPESASQQVHEPSVRAGAVGS